MKTRDLFEANATELNTVVEEKCTVLLEHKRQPTQSTLQALRAARSKVQCTASRCSSDCWVQLCESMPLAVLTRGVSDGIKKAIRPTHSKTGPLKSTTGEAITGRSKQMERWVEHYSDLYGRDATMEAMERLPVTEGARRYAKSGGAQQSH